MEKIIELIDKGDCLSILAEDSLQENFNELLKYRLIDIVDDKVVLTRKGEEAKTVGFEKVIAQLRNEEKRIEVPEEKPQKKSRIYTAGFGFLLALIFIFLIASPMGCSLTH